MIEFKGKLSGKSLQYFLTIERNYMFKIASVCCSIIGIIIVVVSAFTDWLYLVALVMPIALVIASAFVKAGESNFSKILPNRIYVEDNKVVSEHENWFVSEDLAEVKEIVDFGEGYHIKLHNKTKSLKLVCQKSLLTQGTIDEFEKLFEDKLIRKIK